MNNDRPIMKRQKTEQAEFITTELSDAVRKSIRAADHLPIAKKKSEILEKLRKNRVLIISGDTGCGKTTQVPKYIIQQAQSQMEDVYIICTQPRRIAAMNIARRVALELGERVGELVGYQVGMESRVSPRTRIVFMTTGIFLMRLVNNPDSFEKITHIIMDEVHERDLDIDFSLVVIKHLLAKIMNEGTDATGLKFKLLLMSATFNTDLFKNYYSKKGICEIEKDIAYEGVKERYEREAAEKKRKMEEAWGG